MSYSTGAHTTYHNRYHIVWITKYRYKVLTKEIRYRIRDITHQICAQLSVKLIKGVLSNNHVHMFVEIPPRPGTKDRVKKCKMIESTELRKAFRP